MGCGVYHLDDEIRSKMPVDFALAGRKLNIGQAVFAVPEFRRSQFLKEGMLRACGNWYIATICQRDHAQGVLQPLSGSHVARYDGDCTHVQLWRLERERQSYGVIGAGIGVETDFSRRGETGRQGICQENQQQRGNIRDTRTARLEAFQRLWSPECDVA